MAPMDEQTAAYVFKAQLAQRHRQHLAELLKAVLADERPEGAVSEFGEGPQWHEQGKALMEDMLNCPLLKNVLTQEEKQRGAERARSPQTPAAFLRLISATAAALEARRLRGQRGPRQQLAA